MLESSWQEACRTGVLDVRYRFVCNGKLRWLHQRGEILFDAHGKARSAKGSVSDETGRKAQDQATTTSHAELRALSLHLERIREEERTRIAREIHDELGQTLSAVKMDLGWVRTHLRPEQEALHEKVQGIASKIEQTVETVRRIAYELRPPLLDTLGLAAAVMALAEDYQRQMGIRCNVKVPVNLPDLPTPHVSALFRITQELLTNVTRHARASRVDLSLIVEGAQLFLSVGDNGRGIRKQQRETPSLGLLGIRERVAAMGGTLEIVSTPKIAGTQVTICIPVTEKGREH